jgi:hypothetical protein
LESGMLAHGLDCSGSVLEQVVGCCERGNERSGCINCGEFLVWLRTCLLLRKGVHLNVHVLVGRHTDRLDVPAFERQCSRDFPCPNAHTALSRTDTKCLWWG